MQHPVDLKAANSRANDVYLAQNTGQVSSFPEFITVMPLVKCNYDCLMCGESERHSSQQLSTTALARLEGILPFAKSLFITGGEPLLYSHLPRLLRHGARVGCSLSMVTNGSLLTERKREMLLDVGMGEVKFSLDAATPQTYQKIRGGNLYKVLAKIGSLAALKCRRLTVFPEIRLGFVAMRSNIAELGRLVVLARELGVDGIYVSYCVINFKHMIEESLYFHQEYSDRHMLRAIEMAKGVGIRLETPPLFSELIAAKAREIHTDRTLEKCREPWRTIFVRYNGDVNLCCGGGGGCGNLNESSFMEVWNHPARIKAREKVNTPNPLPACLKCHTVKQDALNISTHIPDPGLVRLAQERFGGRVLQELPQAV
jgi:MoaA/NifB/PqqE/SkfB family radical SAM enzyme